MRVRNPRNFAEVLLRAQGGWSMTRINHTIASGQDDVNVSLRPNVPVHIMYFTLWADESGKLRRFDDIYGHDARVLAALRSARS
jgi:murein L,D-transpeptidase YcbB/YkuD